MGFKQDPDMPRPHACKDAFPEALSVCERNLLLKLKNNDPLLGQMFDLDARIMNPFF